MANCNTQQLNITCGTDVVLHDRLIFDGVTFDPNLSVGIAANLVTSLGKRTALDVQVVDDELLISVPWVDGTLPGCYGLEVTGSCNSKKWATYADSLIKYTKATRLGVSEVTVESDSYDITMEIGYRYGEGGNINDVKVNGVSVVSAGKANITMPTNVSQLANDSGYQTAQQVAKSIQDNLVPNAVVTVDANTGTPSATVTKNGNTLNFEFENLKGNPFTYEDFTPQQLASLVGPKGDQGDSAVYNPEDPDTPDFEMANAMGGSTTKAMTQKAVTEELDIRSEVTKPANISGYGIKVEDGSAASTSNYQCTDFIDVSMYDTIYVPVVKTSVIYGYALYDSTKTFIPESGGHFHGSAGAGYDFERVKVNGAKYLRYTLYALTNPYATSPEPTFSTSETVKNEITRRLSTLRIIPTTEKIKGVIQGNTGKWNTSGGGYCYQLFVKAGWTYRITANGSNITVGRWLTEEVGLPVNDQNAPLSVVGGDQIVVTVGATIERLAPSDSKVLCLYANISDTDFTPASVVEIAPTEELLLEQRESINLVDEGGVYRAGSLLFNKDMVPGGSTIWVSFRTINSNATYIRFNDAWGTQLSFFGKASSSSYANRYEGFVTLPSDYKEARVASTTNAGGIRDVKITASKMNYTVKNDVAREMIATQIMRSCKSISQGVLDNGLVTKNAFGANIFILDSHAYVSYYATDSINGDSATPQAGNKGVLQKISLETMEIVETMYPKTTTFLDENGNELSGYTPTAAVPVQNGEGQVARFGQITRAGQHQPIFAYNDFGYLDDVENMTAKVAILQYTANNTDYEVQFSVANYRQMLVDLGYVGTYYAPAYDSFDNNAVLYNPDDGKYYCLMCTVSSNFGSLPLMLMVSDDLATWTIKARIGTDLWKANEISMRIKDGIIYAALRELDGKKWIVYDIANDNIISQGVFPSNTILSRPYVFTYLDDIYMAINVAPSIYGLVENVSSGSDQREEIIIYKVKGDAPIPFLRFNNPSGINYHCWAETPPVIATGSTPMTNYGSIFCAFSEDRRHLYRRAFSQVSFGDVTALFACKDLY